MQIQSRMYSYICNLCTGNHNNHLKTSLMTPCLPLPLHVRCSQHLLLLYSNEKCPNLRCSLAHINKNPFLDLYGKSVMSEVFQQRKE
jgi:hypothetical protein